MWFKFEVRRTSLIPTCFWRFSWPTRLQHLMDVFERSFIIYDPPSLHSYSFSFFYFLHLFVQTFLLFFRQIFNVYLRLYNLYFPIKLILLFKSIHFFISTVLVSICFTKESFECA